MPFDGRKTTPVSSKMRQLLGPNGECWVKGVYVIDSNGDRPKYCLMGAYRVALINEPDLAVSLSQILALSGIIQHDVIENWNDDQARTWQDIERVLDAFEAIEMQENV